MPKTITVTNLKNVDTTSYVEGDIFITEKQIGILHNGKIEPLMKKSDLKDYVKKTDVQALIDETLKKVSK